MSDKDGEKTKGEKTPKVDFETVLIEDIGQMGKFQILTLCQGLFATIFGAFVINEFVFTTTRIDSRCLIPECEGAQAAEFAPLWITNAIPSTEDGSPESCTRYRNVTNSIEPELDGYCPASLFDTNAMVDCAENVYENTMSIVYDFDLGCDEWRRSIIGSVRVLGMMVSLALTGYLSDRFGRRTALVANTVWGAAFGIARYFSNSYNVYVTLMFIESMLACSIFTCIYVMMSEFMGPKYRVLGGIILNSFWAIGQVVLGFVAWLIPNWRNLILALYIPMFLCVFYIWTLNESVRWYLSKGKFDEAEKVLVKAARMNGRELSEKNMAGLRFQAEEERKQRENDTEKKPLLVVLVWRHKRVLFRCCITPIWWITTTLVYYGLSINSTNLTGSMYLNYILVAAVEIPGYWTVILLIDRIGRKYTLLLGFWFCTVCQVAFIFIPNGSTFGLVMYFMGKWAIAIVAVTLYLFTIELYPTEYRQQLFNFSSMVGRLGSIIAPLTPALGATVFPELPYVLFGGMAFLSGLLTFLVPETKGVKLIATMEEANNLGRKL